MKKFVVFRRLLTYIRHFPQNSSETKMATKSKSVWPKVVLFGDSITQLSFGDSCWGASIADFLQRKCDVLNRGFSGYNTRWANVMKADALPAEVLTNTVLVTVFLGANDAAIESKKPEQYIPLDEYASNLRAIVEYLMKHKLKLAQIILIAPPPVDEPEWEKICIEKETVLNRSNENTGSYAKACCQVAKDFGIDYIDTWTLMQEAEEKNWPRFLSDGLHLSAEGGKFLWKKLEPLIEKKTLHLKEIFPDWKDVDHLNPEKTLLQT